MTELNMNSSRLGKLRTLCDMESTLIGIWAATICCTPTFYLVKEILPGFLRFNWIRSDESRNAKALICVELAAFKLIENLWIKWPWVFHCCLHWDLHLLPMMRLSKLDSRCYPESPRWEELSDFNKLLVTTPVLNFSARVRILWAWVILRKSSKNVTKSCQLATTRRTNDLSYAK